MPASKLGVSPRGRLRADHRLCRQGRPSRESANRGPPLARLLSFFHRRITAVRPAVNREGGGSNPPGGATQHICPCRTAAKFAGPSNQKRGFESPQGYQRRRAEASGLPLQNTQARHLSAFVQFFAVPASRSGSVNSKQMGPRVRPLSDRHNSFVGFCFSLPVSRSGWVIVNQRYQRPSCTTRSPVFFRGPERLGYPW